MTTLVLDTSVVVKWLNQENEADLDKADQILQDAEDGTVTLLAPELLKYEIGNVLLCGKKLNADQANTCLVALYSLPIQFVSEAKPEARQTFVTAKKLGITYYDAAFITVAKTYKASLVTDNTKHQGKTTEATVIALKDYVCK